MTISFFKYTLLYIISVVLLYLGYIISYYIIQGKVSSIGPDSLFYWFGVFLYKLGVYEIIIFCFFIFLNFRFKSPLVWWLYSLFLALGILYISTEGLKFDMEDRIGSQTNNFSKITNYRTSFITMIIWSIPMGYLLNLYYQKQLNPGKE